MQCSLIQKKLAAILLFVVASSLGAQSPSHDESKTQVTGYWIDPSTRLTWAGKDNAKDISY
jgi:hypothetical protein